MKETTQAYALTPEVRRARMIQRGAMVLTAGLALLAIAEPALAQSGGGVAGIVKGLDKILTMAKYTLYTLAVVAVMVTGVMAAWQGDKSYLIKGLALALGIAVAGYAAAIVQELIGDSGISAPV